MNVVQLVLMTYLASVGTVAAWLILRRIDRVEDRLEKRLDGADARIDGLERRISGLPTREEFNALGERIGRVEYELAALRSDLTQIALAVGARVRPQTG